ncbi:MAG: hypothetical protein R3D00_22630 [Bacteroidia bacterium]
MKRIILLLSCFLSVSMALAEGFPEVVIHILQPENERQPESGLFQRAIPRSTGENSAQFFHAKELFNFSYHTRKTVELIILTPDKQIAGIRVLTQNTLPEIFQVPVNRWKSGEYVFIFRGEGYFASHRVWVNSSIP